MKKITAVLLMGLLAVASVHAQQLVNPGGGNQLVSGPFGTIVVGAPISGTPCSSGQVVYNNAGVIGCQAAGGVPSGAAGGDLSGTYPNPTLATTQTGAHTWSAIQTFTLAPVFTDASGSRTALGLGALATVTPGTGVATALGVNVGSAGAPVLFNGAGGTPSSLTATNATGLPASGIGSGQVALARGGTNADLSATGGTSQFLKQASTGAAVTVVRPVSTDLSDTTAPTTWTPTDNSGASLTFTTVTAIYTKVGKLLNAQFRLTYPSTASGASASIGGLPVSSFTGGSIYAIGYCNYSAGIVVAQNSGANSSSFIFITTAGAALTNVALSAGDLTCNITYVSN